jgi:hypothetical protein
VKPTFSGVGSYLTGLPGAKTLEGERQNLGDLVEPFGGTQLIRMERIGTAIHRVSRWLQVIRR